MKLAKHSDSRLMGAVAAAAAAEIWEPPSMKSAFLAMRRDAFQQEPSCPLPPPPRSERKSVATSRCSRPQASSCRSRKAQHSLPRICLH